jgi:hypothetical protein
MGLAAREKRNTTSCSERLDARSRLSAIRTGTALSFREIRFAASVGSRPCTEPQPLQFCHSRYRVLACLSQVRGTHSDGPGRMLRRAWATRRTFHKSHPHSGIARSRSALLLERPVRVRRVPQEAAQAPSIARGTSPRIASVLFSSRFGSIARGWHQRGAERATAPPFRTTD